MYETPMETQLDPVARTAVAAGTTREMLSITEPGGAEYKTKTAAVILSNFHNSKQR
jgi:hypothetical protein